MKSNLLRQVISITAISVSLLFSVSASIRAADKADVSKYLCRDLQGAKRWEGATAIAPGKEKNMYLLTEEGSGAYSGFEGQVRWKTEMEFFDDGKKVMPMHFKKIFTGANGTPVFEATQEFYPEKNEVVYTKKWLASGKEVNKTFKYEGDIVNDAILGLYTERFLANGEKEKTFYLVSNDPSIYKISAVVGAEEDVTVNGQVIKAYKISLEPQVGLFGMFAPKTYVWHLARPGFDWLKYRGCEDTIDSPEVEMETLDDIK